MSLKRKEDGFTGLEAAIVLIAFIVVAAVFSYVMLGAGFFTTQKSQETVFGAVGQATANMEVSGPVVIYTDTNTDVSSINFTVVLAAGGAPMDTSKFTYVASSQTAYHELNASQVDYIWYVQGSAGTTKTFLERGDILEVGISGTAVDIVTANKPFTIEVKPTVGASLPINRLAPLSLQASQVYEVY
ncbi:archaellin/type IV pilin N-terminal domain-containing protein [Methanocalculus sp. MC3]